MGLDAFFLPAACGPRFCLLHEPDASLPARGAVLYIHPFGEEMNKSRRMAAVQARALAAAGYTVLQIDLRGCGDSAGEFGDATWQDWVDDVLLAHDFLRRRGFAEPWLWGLRSGCLLACAAIRELGGSGKLLLWQPVVAGKQFLQQFLRLKVAGEMLAGDAKGLMEDLRQRLARGEAVEVAGYTLSAALAGGLEQAELVLPGTSQRVEWIEVSSRPESGLSPAASLRLDKWRGAGHSVGSTLVGGPAFWQTAEIAECGELVAATLAALNSERQP